MTQTKETTPADHVKAMAKMVIDHAKQSGLVVTITTAPRSPLAMGNYDMVVDVRPARVMSIPKPPDSPEDREFAYLVNKAEEIVVEYRKPSISLVQRHLRISYNMATKLIESLEVKGVIGFKDGIRTVLKDGPT